MHRLVEHQLVTVCPPPDLARVSAFPSYIVAIDGPVLSLHAERAADVAWLPPKLNEVMLTFEQDRRMVALRGMLRYQASTEDLRFRVSDNFSFPRRRSSPLQLCAPATLTPLDGGGAAAAAPIEVQTQELAPDGLLLEGEVPRGVFDVALTLPKDPQPVRARAVVREAARVEFIAIAPVERRRIRAFVADHLRERFKLLRAYQELDDEPF